MNSNFDKAMSFVFSWEGGYSNDPDDPGGETNYGISKRSYPNEDILNMTKERAMEIYKHDYWTPAGCETLAWPMDIIMFDTAVNMGLSRANAFYQENPTWQDYLFARINRYNDIAAKNPKYLRGWLNRVLALWKFVRR